MLSRDLELSLNLAYRTAHLKKHEFITVEHLLLALLDNESALNVLEACGADVFELREVLTQFIDTNTPKVETDEYEIEATDGFRRVLQRAVFHVQSSGNDRCQGEDVLIAIYRESESQAVYFLLSQDVHRIDMVNFVSHGIRKSDYLTLEDEGEWQEAFEKDMDIIETPENKSALEYFAVNLNEKAANGEIDSLIGRDYEVERICQILLRRRKNNPLLVGESGVGKTAIAEGLAWQIVNKKVPDALLEATIYSLDIGSVVAGTKYRGDFEERFKVIISELSKIEQAVLFIDEIHMIIGAGAVSGGVMDASNLLKPLLSSGKIRCMGSTTYQEFRGVFEKDKALSRRFQKIDVLEPSVDETFNILMGLRKYFERHHSIKYNDKALRAASELSSKHITDRFLPDKAIDVIDEAGAFQKLRTKPKKTIDVIDIEKVISKIARIPEQTITAPDKIQLAKLEEQLKLVVYGQDEAIDAVSSVIKLSRSGLKNEEKPIGSFLFAGPTGVGKTEVCKQLANLMNMELLRYDMSEYMERHSVSRLIGAPPGYVGFDQGGLLTDAILKHPHAVLLLDEVEKAHPDLFNLLLQVMDYGTLTDNNGRKIDFRNVIIIMTTNAGAMESNRASMGFAKQDHSSDAMETIKRLFTPEFRNRLDKIVQFDTLPKAIIHNVVDKFLTELQAQLDGQRVQLDIDDEVIAWLAERGFDEKMGARPMARLIQETIKQPLADEILFGKLSNNGGEVIVRIVDSELQIQCKSTVMRKRSNPKKTLVNK